MTRSFWRVGAAAVLLVSGAAGCGPLPVHAGSSQSVQGAPMHSQQAVIRVTPNFGPPGTMVTMKGYLPSMYGKTMKPPSSSMKFQGTIGFGGLTNGLSMTVSSFGGIYWSTAHPGEFQAKFQVPQSAWLAPDGVHALKPGTYEIAIRCFGPLVRGCASKPDQARTTFRLTGPTPPAKSGQIHLSPPAAQPGQVVLVNGWAPLTPIIGRPIGYSLTLQSEGQGGAVATVGQVAQSTSGALTGSFRVPATLPSLGAVSPGPARMGLSYRFFGSPAVKSGEELVSSLPTASFTVVSPTSWQKLGNEKPLGLRSNTTALSVAGQSMVVSGPAGSIWVSRDGGIHLKRVSLNAITTLSQTVGYPAVWSPGGKPSAQSVLLNPAFPHSIFVSVDSVQGAKGSAPPVYFTPYVTTDDGARWNSVPVPPGYQAGDFGGFHRVGARVYAEWQKSGGKFMAEYTGNGGTSWVLGVPTCPAAGPCLRFGPSPSDFPGMGVGQTQPVWRKNQRSQWVTAATVDLNQGASQLAGEGWSRALLLDPSSPYPLELSLDQGRQWKDIALPLPPDIATTGSPFQQLLLLSNGSLLAQMQTLSGNNVWRLLPAQSGTWQLVPAQRLPDNARDVTAVGGSVWWIQSAPGSNSTPSVHRVADSAL